MKEETKDSDKQKKTYKDFKSEIKRRDFGGKSEENQCQRNTAAI